MPQPIGEKGNPNIGRGRNWSGWKFESSPMIGCAVWVDVYRVIGHLPDLG